MSGSQKRLRIKKRGKIVRNPKNKNEENHTIGRFTRDENWNVQDFVSETGDIVSQCIACALCSAVANSIQNQKSDTLIPLDMNELQTNIESITTKFNNNQQAIEMASEL